MTRWSDAEYADYLARQTLQASAFTQKPTRALERDFQARVIKAARTLGYRTYHTHRSDRSEKGWFDLAMARPGDKLVLAELKKAGEKQTEEQRDWYEDLQRIERVETYLWYPKDYDAILAILAQRS